MRPIICNTIFKGLSCIFLNQLRFIKRAITSLFMFNLEPFPKKPFTLTIVLACINLPLFETSKTNKLCL